MDTNANAEPTPDVKQSADLDQPRQADGGFVLKDTALPNYNSDISSSRRNDSEGNIQNKYSTQ